MSYTHGLRAALLASSAIVAAYASPAWAQSADFDLPAQPAATGIAAFADQADIQILVMESDTRGKLTKPVRGTMTMAAGLQELLSGTGLHIAANDGRTVTLSAQDPQGGSAAGGGAEVEALIVTAQKREEDIQDVPIAISAFSQKDLETRQVAGGPDLITQVPNMSFTKTNFTSYSIQIRGIGTQAISATTDPAVAVAFNNTPFIRNRFFEQEFYDLQRVEVLRGPQGTLYGRNATAGVVNIISAKPKFAAEAKLSGDVANYNSTRLEGMINLPLVEDQVALRLAGAWTKRDGYATNEISGNPIDGRDLWSTRVSLGFEPTDSIRADFIWEHFEENDDRIRSGKQLCNKHVVTKVGNVELTSFTQLLPDRGQSGFPAQSTFSQGCIRESLYSPNSFQTPNGLSVPYYYPLGYIGLARARIDPYQSAVQSHDLRVIESVVDPRYKAMADLGEVQVSWDISDTLTLASETAYSADAVWSTQDFNRFNTAPGAWDPERAVEGVVDDDGVFCDPQIGCSDRLVAIDLSTGDSRQFSQELRLSSDFDGPFNFSLGGNFLRFDGEDKYYVFINSITLSRVGDLFGSFGDMWSKPWVPGVSDGRECLPEGPELGDPLGNFGYGCVLIEPNSIENIQDEGHNYFLSRNPYRLISYALFGEAYYNITETLKVTGGLRWTVDKKHAPRIPSWTFIGNTYGYPVMEVIDQEWREPTGRLAIDWKPDLSFTDETLLYASYAHGYKAGGANPPPMTLLGAATFGAGSGGGGRASATRPKTFEAEFVDAFELGSKNTLADGAVTLNLAAFYYDYRGYQISEIVDRSAFNRNFDATIWGLEIEADWRPLENLKFGFKGGYENTAIADGEQAIDLMDRTAGRDDWVVVRPFPTNASSCVLPVYVFERPDGPLIGPGGMSGGNPGPCELTYLQGLDPVTEQPYIANPPPSSIRSGTYPGYLGFNPFDASQGHNFGEGFLKDIGGNPLPNAPEFTATITADYTLPLPNEWLATLHTDLYWQSESNWRVFDDHEFNQLDEYFTMNLAAIFTNEDAGWKVMAYVKNVFDRDSITGAFLNSDDTALTTNVFLTEPRLYGLRVTKEWTGGGWWTGADPNHPAGEPYPFTLELGGQAQRHDAPYDPLRPGFADTAPAALDIWDGVQNGELDWGDGREVKLTYQPNGSPWKASLGARFGKTNGTAAFARAEEQTDVVCGLTGTYYDFYCDPEYLDGLFYDDFNVSMTNWSTSRPRSDREEFQLTDFSVGRDVGIGGLSESTLSMGLRYAQFKSSSNLTADTVPDWYLPEGWFYSVSTPDAPYSTRSLRQSNLNARREFEGAGVTLSWDAAVHLLGNDDTGRANLDWALGGGALFGKQRVEISGSEVTTNYLARFLIGAALDRPVSTVTTPILIRRSESVTVPSVNLSLGLSYEVQRIRIGAGYRWERYFDVLDVGYDEHKDADRTIDGPYFKLSVGFGG